jgi:hypothetical protein
MDWSQLMPVAALALLAVIIIAALWILRQRFDRVSAEVEGPFGAKLKVGASRPAQGGIRMKGIATQTGSVTANNQTGGGIEMERVSAYEHVTVTAGPAEKKQDP